MINPWTIIAAIVLAIAVAFGADHFGHERGMNQQKVADQQEFDALNQKLADQKAQANDKWRDSAKEALKVAAERDKLKTQLGAVNVKNQDITNKLRDAYAAYSLRFSTFKDSGCGNSAGCAEGGGREAASNEGAEIVQLPEAITRSLRQLTYEADQLNDDYKLCYGYANR